MTTFIQTLPAASSLGDSGYAIIRNSSIIYRQRPQTHYFNCPKYVLIIGFPHKSDVVN